MPTILDVPVRRFSVVSATIRGSGEEVDSNHRSSKMEMAKVVPDAASYAPVTILVDERDDGVHLSYDSMESFLTPYRHQSALKVARDLDAKIEGLLETAAL